MEQEQAATPHKYSKLLLTITIAILVIGGGLTAYFINSANQNKIPPPASETTTEVTADTTTGDANIAKAKEELDNVDIQELKTAVAELKTALAAFSQ